MLLMLVTFITLFPLQTYILHPRLGMTFSSKILLKEDSRSSTLKTSGYTNIDVGPSLNKFNFCEIAQTMHILTNQFMIKS